MTKLSKEYIVELLGRKDKVGMHAVGRALLHLYNRQTFDEQKTRSTRHLNAMGFRPCHASVGPEHALFYKHNGYLKPEQLAFWQSTTRRNPRPRIAIYWRQLLEEAQMRAVERSQQKPENKSKLESELELAKMEYVDVVESDSRKLIEPVLIKLRLLERKLGVKKYFIAGCVVYDIPKEVLDRIEKDQLGI